MHGTTRAIRPAVDGSPVPHLIATLITLLSGIIAGLSITWLTVVGTPPTGMVRLGVWAFAPRVGASDVDPYVRGATVVRGDLPLGIGEGLALTAQSDSMGDPLDARCAYGLSGAIPSARYWTLARYAPDGTVADATTRRHAFTSSEIVRAHDGTFEITIARTVQPGNWLPLGDESRFVLMLRLYDTPLSASATTLRETDLPTISRRACQP